MYLTKNDGTTLNPPVRKNDVMTVAWQRLEGQSVPLKYALDENVENYGFTWNNYVTLVAKKDFTAFCTGDLG